MEGVELRGEAEGLAERLHLQRGVQLQLDRGRQGVVARDLPGIEPAVVAQAAQEELLRRRQHAVADLPGQQPVQHHARVPPGMEQGLAAADLGIELEEIDPLAHPPRLRVAVGRGAQPVQSAGQAEAGAVHPEALAAQQQVLDGVVGAAAQDAQAVVAGPRRRAVRPGVGGDVALDGVQRADGDQGLLAAADDGVAGLHAEHPGDPVIPQGAQEARGVGAAGPAIQPHPHAGAADEDLGRGLAEGLRVVEAVQDADLGPLAELGEAVEPGDRQELLRPGALERPVVRRQQAVVRLAADLGDQGDGGRVGGGGAQHRAHGDAGHVVGEQQVAFEGGDADRPLLGDAAQEAEHLDAGRADVAVELHVGDVALDDADAQVAAGVHGGGDGGEQVAGGPVAGQQVLAGLLDAGQRHGGSGQARGDGGEVGGREYAGAGDGRAADRHRLARRELGGGRRAGLLQAGCGLGQPWQAVPVQRGALRHDQGWRERWDTLGRRRAGQERCPSCKQQPFRPCSLGCSLLHLHCPYWAKIAPEKKRTSTCLKQNVASYWQRRGRGEHGRAGRAGLAVDRL